MEQTHQLHDLINRFATYQQAVGRAVGTRERYRFTFLLFERFLDQEQIPPDSRCLSTPIMERFAMYLRDTPTNPQHGNTKREESGIHAHLRDMRAFTRWLYKTELLDWSVEFPMPKLPRRLFRILTDEELERMWQSKYLTGTSHRSIRNRAMIALMLDTGLRREEVASLRLANVSIERRTVTVIGKGNKERRVFFSPSVKDRLREFLAIRGIDNEPLFHLNADGIRTTFRRIQQDTGLDAFHPHMLRHQFATMMLRQTKSMEYVRLLLGHEDYNTTKRYLSLTDEDLQEAHEAASPFDSLMRKTAKEPIPLPRRHRYSSKESA